MPDRAQAALWKILVAHYQVLPHLFDSGGMRNRSSGLMGLRAGLRFNQHIQLTPSGRKAAENASV
jgi:hypothetical protein